MGRVRAWTIGTAAGVCVVALALTGLSKLAFERVAHSDVLWEHSARNVTVLNGEVYELSSGEGGEQHVDVTRVDPADGSTEQTWSHPSLTLPYLTRRGDVLFRTSHADVDADRHTTELTLYSADDTEIWAAKITHRSGASLFVTAAMGRSIHVAVCNAGTSTPVSGDAAAFDSVTVSTCQLRTIDDAGRVSDPLPFIFPWEAVAERFGWDDLPGAVLPRVTLAPRDLRNIDAFSPSSSAAIATFPYSANRPLVTIAVTPDHVLSTASADGICAVRGISTLASAEASWSSTVACNSTDVLSLAATSDPTGPIYLGLAGPDDVSIVAVDQSTGDTVTVPAEHFSHVYMASIFDMRRRVVDVTAGGMIIGSETLGPDGLAGSQMRVTDAVSGDAVLTATLPGTLHLPASAHSTTLAVSSDVSESREDLPWQLRFNPLALTTAFEAVTVFAAGDGRAVARAFVGAHVTSLVALPGDRALVTTDDGRAFVVGSH